MKSDEDVRMISAEAPVLFAKAAELFVLDLTIRYEPTSHMLCWDFEVALLPISLAALGAMRLRIE
jgi:hypothetical protein